MSLTAGTRLGPYEVTAQIGQGGMGEVYRARDTKLDRHVALKVLPDLFADDPERLARFQREAKVLASLNHPNIAQIYGLEESGATRALVLELVEGPTLAERIAQGAIPVDEALPIAKQIADALEAAHEAGVIHRDLKPANVKVKPDGMVKVLDFGLAKALEPEESGDPSQSPTMTAADTKMGVIMGTEAYMSPEQAKGRSVDKRADIWAFGVVLYEMLSGRQAFPGQTVSDVLASVLAREPGLAALPTNTPPTVRRLLARCLEKDPRRRLRDIGEARVELEPSPAVLPAATTEAGPTPQPVGWRRTVAGNLAFFIVGATVAAIAAWNLRPEAPLPLVRFAVTPQPEVLEITASDTDVVMSPDGTRIVYTGRAEGGQRELFVRSREQLEARPLRGLGTPRTPFISPDNDWVGYFDGPALKRVSIQGGPAVTICDLPGGIPRGASWGSMDTIFFATSIVTSGLWRVAASGGEPEQLTTPDPEKGEVDHQWPEVLPGGQDVLFTITTTPVQNSQIAVLSLETGEQKVLVQGGSNPHYSPTGHLVYGVEGTLRAVRFDLDRLETIGNPVPVLEDVNTKSSGAANFSFSKSGWLVYASSDAASIGTLGWVDRDGQMTPLMEAEGLYGSPSLSPDGTRVALSITGGSGIDIRVVELERGASTRLTADGTNLYPSWTPDGTKVTFASNRSGVYDLYWKPWDGSSEAEVLVTSPDTSITGAWSPDGQSFVYYEVRVERDIWTLALGGDSSPLLATEFNERAPRVSPDGDWLAYVSNQSGQDQVHVQPFPEGSAVIQISTEGGTEPVWSRDGRELFYRNGNQMMVVDVETDPEFRVGRPRELFEEPYETDPNAQGIPNYDVSLDGEQFLMVRRGSSRAAGLIVIQNWFEDLNARVPVN